MLNKTTYKNAQLTFTPPEKVLQFGTGVLLRGLCDFIIDKANKANIFNGSIVIIKTTGPDISEFTNQDNLYTVCIRGFESGIKVEQNLVIESISRVLSTKTHWEDVLETAENPEINIVISNTTEVGLQYVEEPVLDICPDSFPGKLTTWLHKRFSTNKADVTIIPTELLVNNGNILKSLITKQVEANKLGSDFQDWINEHVTFCNSLVDRIVPGKPNGEELAKLNAELGYEDNLLIKAEAYKLWAIEGEGLEEKLPFYAADSGVKLEKNIEKYRELKLRLLNAPHTLLCGLSYLSGFEYVKETLNDEMMEKYITILMLTELGPSIDTNLDLKTTQRYGREVIDRFRNPYLDHKWLSITLQYTMKMKLRAIPLLLNYYHIFETVPQYFTRCFSAYLLFMRAKKEENGVFYGQFNGEYYPINCDSAAFFKEVWDSNDLKHIIKASLSNIELWGTDLTLLKGFADNVENHLSNMIHIGVKEVASALNVYA